MTTKEISTLKSETELLTLGRMLDRAAADASDKMAAIPDDISLDDEHAAIEAASALPDAICARIAVLEPRNQKETIVKARAFAWMEGTYWQTPIVELTGRMAPAI